MSQAPSSYNDMEFLGTLRNTPRRLAGVFTQSRGHFSATIGIASGYGANLIFQMAYFVILTRMLGAELLGRYAAAYAIINLAAPLAGMGFSEIALVRVSENKERSLSWAVNSLAVTTVLGLVVSSIVTIAAALVGSKQLLSWHLILGLAVSELVFVAGCRVMARVHQGRHESWRYSVINGSIGAVKAIIAICVYQSGFSATGAGSLVAMIILFNLCYLPVLVLLFVSLVRRETAPAIVWTDVRAKLSWAQIKRELKLAFSFVTDLSCQTLYTNLDKLLLAGWSSSFVVGTYSAGYRLLTVSAMPIRAMSEATFPHQVKLARDDRQACRRFTANIFSLNLVLSIVIAALIYLLAPLAPLILGADFQASVSVLRWGSLLPIAQGCNCTLGKYLTATKRQSVRAKLQLVVTVAFVAMGLITIPLYSWKGAVSTGLVCESLLAVLFGVGCLANPDREAADVEHVA